MSYPPPKLSFEGIERHKSAEGLSTSGPKFDEIGRKMGLKLPLW